jgi:hypothetical protein
MRSDQKGHAVSSGAFPSFCSPGTAPILDRLMPWNLPSSNFQQLGNERHGFNWERIYLAFPHYLHQEIIV